jgi:hypothetical protein
MMTTFNNRGSEQRKSTRRPCGLEPSCRLFASLTTVPSLVTVRNLSTGGVSLTVDQRIDPGTLVWLELFNTTQNYHCQIEMEVVYIYEPSPDEFILGGIFTRELTDVEVQGLIQ